MLRCHPALRRAKSSGMTTRRPWSSRRVGAVRPPFSSPPPWHEDAATGGARRNGAGTPCKLQSLPSRRFGHCPPPEAPPVGHEEDLRARDGSLHYPWHGKRFRHGRIPECSGHGNRGIRGANRANWILSRNKGVGILMARHVDEDGTSSEPAPRNWSTTTPDGVESPGTTAGSQFDTPSREIDGETLVHGMGHLVAGWREQRTAGSLMDVVIGSVPV